MSILFLLLGGAYGFFSSKGQFCMNSGFSNVSRNRDTTKLKAYALAILVQMALLPLLFIFREPLGLTSFKDLQLPALAPVAVIVGGYLFGLFMRLSGGCAAGIFYKLGEQKLDALFAIAGFSAGVWLLEQGFGAPLRSQLQSIQSTNQTIYWGADHVMVVGLATSAAAALASLLLLRLPPTTPGGASYSWKTTGLAIATVGILTWVVALLAKQPFGMSIVPGHLEWMQLSFFTSASLFVVGIPLGGALASWKKWKEKPTLPNGRQIVKRLLGGLGMGASASLAAGCTVGHGLTFVPLLGLGSIVALVAIFLGSLTVGFNTRPKD